MIIDGHGVPLKTLAIAVTGLIVPISPIGFTPQSQGGIEKSVLVSVVGESSVPLTDLTATDFRVREDGTARPILDAKLATETLFVALLVDTAKPMLGVTPPTQELRRAVTTFSEILDAADADAKIALFEFGGAAVKTQDFTTPAVLAKSLD